MVHGHGKLDLSESAMPLPANLFQPKSSLFCRKSQPVEQLLLRRNRLTCLKKYAKALHSFRHHLLELSLRDNLLLKFPIEIMSLKQLTTLSLSNNALTVIETQLLPHLPHMQWLSLGGNQLKDLPSDIVCCRHLKGLDLQNNQFEVFPSVIFELQNLEVLLLQKNHIRELSGNDRLPRSLHTLNLAFNKLTQLPLALTEHPPAALTHLHLSGNELRRLSETFLLKGYQHLVSLDLHTCGLEYLSPEFFKRLATNCKGLRRLNLAINCLANLPAEIGDLTELQWLNLNDNRLSELPTTLARLVNLVKLGLVQNHLRELPSHLFCRMKKLQKIDIRRNKLMYLPPSILALAPRDEKDGHIDLAVPHLVFPLVSSYPSDPKSDTKTSGGSLRTLLLYENSFMHHIDGLIEMQPVTPEDTDDEADVMEGKIFEYQLLSLQQAFEYLDNIPHVTDERTMKQVLVMAMLSKAQDRETVVNVLGHVPSLREVVFSQYANRSHTMPYCHRPFCIESRPLFVESQLPSTVPLMLRKSLIHEAKPCDHCGRWYERSRLQIGYLARLCNNRLQVSVRYSLCSSNCALLAIIALYKAKKQWQQEHTLVSSQTTQPLLNSIPFTQHGQPQPQPQPQLQPRQETDRDAVNLAQESRALPNSWLFTLPPDYILLPQQSSLHTNPTPLGSETMHPLQVSWQAVSGLIRHRMNQFTSSVFVNQSGSGSGSDGNHSPQSMDRHRSQTVRAPSFHRPILADVASRLLQEPPAQPPPFFLTAPTPSIVAFNHLPRDAVRLERF
ncbi:uncharacterized protein BYT42DRAFT_617238 [Radiomyces spectabilis]|uniref:uncharacterized protein n=1 Tax=Radiomyces spectabilis TaxID=64574 RepID=UPI00221E9527|nr:uncharacterized protein BYT42DRAFT_617238 [Radiomyces spectabilis]KAI8370719.1 hypothetical protein BYT42DRAFT_617238 [Radiomyces spectabilis]